MNAAEWAGYLDRFHQERPGITEDVLATARSDAVGDPYSWLLSPLDGHAAVLDVACGSAPLRHRIGHDRWVGIDRSPGELRRAGEACAGPLVRGDATVLPFGDGAFSSVVCSMAIMLLQPFGTALAELIRVLAPGGVGVLLLPGRRPLTALDLARYGRLMLLLHRVRLAYPNDREVAHLPSVLRTAGLRVTDDTRLRFRVPFDDEASVARFVESLYLPWVPARRVSAAVTTLGEWVGSDIGVPLRRVVFRRAS